MAGAAFAIRSSAATRRSPLHAEIEVLRARQDLTEARHEITEVLHRYARGWDREDEATIRDCFWPDSTHQHGAFRGLSHEFVAISFKATRNVKLMSHSISNISIEIVGNRAVSECHFLAYHRRPSRTGSGEVDWFLKGRYLDRFERRSGVWKIAHRRGLHDFARTFEPADTSLASAPADQLSAPRPLDPLYAMLEELRTGR
ncbi:MAG: nuclear transport factor 2 family protein [Steroidobacteraceae bacterium]|nr:nuclear transport factor 2 family protein [Steroidobacteraceae bacterium]MDW8260294.1 nuclear transport factor 2 family protein [Gammaproteobacteria bacterium]